MNTEVKNEEAVDAVEKAQAEKDSRNPKLKTPIALADILAMLVSGDYTGVPVMNQKVASGRPVISRGHTVEPIRAHKKVRFNPPSPPSLLLSTETYFLATLVEKMILINDDIMPGNCSVEGCNCGTMGRVMKTEILDWVNKNAPDIKVVMTTEDKLSDLFYEGYTEFFADNINFETDQK